MVLVGTMDGRLANAGRRSAERTRRSRCGCAQAVPDSSQAGGSPKWSGGVGGGVADVAADVVVGEVALPVVEAWLGRCASGRKGRDDGGQAEGGEDRACDVGVGDEAEDAAASATGAGEDVLGEHSLEEVSPREGSPSVNTQNRPVVNT